MKRKYVVVLIIVVVVGSGIFWNRFINPDPSIAELKQMITDSKTSTFSVKKWEEADRYSKKAIKFKEKDELMSSGNEFAVTGVKLKAPYGIACLPEGILLADHGENCLYLIDYSGNLVRKIGELGNGPNQFQKPTGCTYHNGYYYVIDSGNKRIVILDRQFNYTKELKLPKSERESEKEFTDIAINDKDDIYISGSYLYDSGLYRYNLEKEKFENVQKYFYGSLKEFDGEVYAVDQFRIYVDFNKNGITCGPGPNALWKLNGKNIKKIANLPAGLNAGTFDLFMNTLIICSPFHSTVMAFNMNDGKYISNIYEVDKMDYKMYASIHGSELYITEPEKGKILKISLEKLQ
ncbi:MAG: hypothetical protein HG465_002485 [Mogibacterium sp.]|uniref:hypothetical protein n=1 Tax=Mogibacterium sp. TaxID=2049035 RepID=UPI0017F39E74|nr:hypothetical protein [Mogibacterium sp.]MBB1532979.1 hypothetical protein [Mogibacterium sp.]